MSFKRIFYNHKTNKIHHWYLDENGKTRREEFHPEIEYYIKDENSKSNKKDIFGNPVSLQTTKSRYNLKDIQEYETTYEAGLPEDVKFLQKRYGNKELKVQLDKFQIATIDIEVEAKGKFDGADEPIYPINLISMHLSKQDQVYTFGTKPYTGDSDLVKNYRYCTDERTLLVQFIRFFRKAKVDIISGWFCLPENEYVWCDDGICKIKDIDVGTSLKKYGSVDKTYKTGFKDEYSITLSNGYQIASSEDHVFPFYFKNKSSYKNSNSLLEQFSEDHLKNIIKKIDDDDIYMRVEKVKNENDDVIYKNFILKNIDEILKYDHIDFIIKDFDIRNRIINYRKKNNLKMPKRIGSLYWKNAPKFWTYKQYSSLIDKNELIEKIKSDDVVLVINNQIFNFDLNTKISGEDLKYIGYVYTDGHLYMKDKCLITTTINEFNLLGYKNIINKYRKNKYNKMKWKLRDRKDLGISVAPEARLRCYYSKSTFSLLIPMIFNKKFKKELNVSLLSQLSHNQFINFFSGVIDGDGTIGNAEENYNVVSYCDFTDTGIKSMYNLLSWNSVFCYVYKNAISIPCLKFNKKFIKSLNCFHSERNQRIDQLRFYTKKNSISKKIKFFEYDDFFIVKVKKIEKTGRRVEMCDISTSTSYFISNGIKTHNCRLFDMPYIIKRCEILNIKESLSPIGIYREKSKHAGYKIDGGGYEIAGISILDGLDLYKNFEREKRQSYSLNAIGLIEVGEGKLDFEGSINDLWERDWNRYVEYNIQDVLLTKKINDTKRYIELTINFCYQALVPFEKIFTSVNLVTGFMGRYLHNHDMVLPDKAQNIVRGNLDGAFVMANVGMHKYCMSFDVESMYPHMIIRYNISPETLVMYPKDTTGLISTPIEGVYYKKDKVGVLAEVVSNIFNDRKRMKNKWEVCKRLENGMSDEEVAEDWEKPVSLVKELKEESEKEHGNASYYYSQQYIRKILVNSIYGCVSNEHFVFYNLNNARVVTGGGQSLIKFLSKTTNEYFLQNINKIIKKCFPHIKKKISLSKPVCILIDTDSNYLCFEEIIEKLGIEFKDMAEFREWALTINEKFFEPFYEKIMKIYFKKFNIDEIINFKKEKIISNVAVLAKKKYAMKVVDNEGEFYEDPKLSFTGIEIVRTDTPVFCRKYLEDVINEIFNTNDKKQVIDKIRDIHEKYLTVPIDQIALAKGVKNYSKYATEPMSTYIETGLKYPKGCPIHVRASMNYNYFVEKYNLPLMPITNGTKMKYVFVKTNNILRQNVVGFIGNWPKDFDKHFEIDKDMLWFKTFISTMQRFFDVLDWGPVKLETTAFEDLEI